MNWLDKRLLFILFGMVLINTKVWAHGGVSIDADKCVLDIGDYRMHFTGYQPQSRYGQEFCEDIPDLGAAIIVLDYVDAGLRKMETGVKIIRYDSWAAAQNAKTDEEAPTVLEMDPNLYKRGSITIEHQFTEPGYFVGLVSSQADGQEPIVSRFPFSVGYGKGSTSSSFNMLMYLGLILLAAGGGYYYLNSQKKKEGEQATA